MKKVLTIAVFGGENNYNSMFDEAEIIAADASALKKAKGKYVVFLQNGFTYRNFTPLLEKAEKCSADIVSFAGGCAFKAQSVKFSDDIFNVHISSALNCKNIEKTDITPFKLAEGEIDCNESAFEKLEKAISEYTAAKTKAPIEVYSFSRDLICERLCLFYKCYMLAVRMGADNKRLADFDENFKKSDMVLYKVFENRFGHTELAKLRLKKFKISFITANKYKKELNIK